MQAREIGDTIKLMKLVIFYQLRYDIVGLLDVCRTRKFEQTVKSRSRIPGWYVAEVQSSSIEDDEISVVYVSEPDCVYTVEVVPFLAQEKRFI